MLYCRNTSAYLMITILIIVVYVITGISIASTIYQIAFISMPLNSLSPVSANSTGDPLHSRALAHSRAPLFTQPCSHCSHSRAPGEQWARLCVFTLHGCVQAARLCRGSPVNRELLEGSCWIETFSGYWSFVRGIHRSPVDSTHKGQWRGALIFFYVQQTKGWWFETPWRSMWRHSNVTFNTLHISNRYSNNKRSTVLWSHEYTDFPFLNLGKHFEHAISTLNSAVQNTASNFVGIFPNTNLALNNEYRIQHIQYA